MWGGCSWKVQMCRECAVIALMDKTTWQSPIKTSLPSAWRSHDATQEQKFYVSPNFSMECKFNLSMASYKDPSPQILCGNEVCPLIKWLQDMNVRMYSNLGQLIILTGPGIFPLSEKWSRIWMCVCIAIKDKRVENVVISSLSWQTLQSRLYPSRLRQSEHFSG